MEDLAVSHGEAGTVHCGSRPISEVNSEIRQKIAAGARALVIKESRARHNLAVGLLEPVSITVEGSVGYYCGGMMDGPTIKILGSAGWGVGESMLSGHITVMSDAGNGAAAAIRGGTVVIHGDAAARLGVSMKGGVVVVAGDCGYMAGFMAQKGTLIVCGNAGDAFGDSLYATTCYVGGQVRQLGTDAVIAPLTSEDRDVLARELAQLPPAQRKEPDQFRKIVAGRKLWNFDKADWKVWSEAL